jgi:hypothetical protein
MTWYDRRCNRWRGMENEDSLLDMIALQLAMMSTLRERERERERERSGAAVQGRGDLCWSCTIIKLLGE